jgi:hypothetical protein
MTFPGLTQVIKVEGEVERISKEFSGTTIDCPEEVIKQEPKRGLEVEESPNEVLPQLTMGALEDDPLEFMRILAEGEKLNN